MRSKKISVNKNVSAVLGVLFPLAFCWRTYWSSKMWLQLLQVGKNYIAMNPVLANQVLWRAGEVSVLTVVCSNFVWTYRILRGSLKVVMKKNKGKTLPSFQKEIE